MTQFNGLSKVEGSEIKTSEKASPAYSTPFLLNLGKAHDLVQGTDLWKMTVDPNKNYHD